MNSWSGSKEPRFSVRSTSASDLVWFKQNCRKLVPLVPRSLKHSLSHHSLKSMASDCFVSASFFPFKDELVAGDEDSVCSIGLPMDFCLLNDPPGVPFTGVFLFPQLPWVPR
nr:hypothetical protein Iba_chr01cCG14150 [Ipomoea batatas]